MERPFGETMKTVKKKIKALIFDMDGTIIQSEHIWSNATYAILQKRGFTSFSPEQKKALNSLSGLGMEECWTYLKKHFTLEESVEQLSGETHNYAHQLFSQGVAFVKGFEQFHNTTKEHNMATAIATNADGKVPTAPAPKTTDDG